MKLLFAVTVFFIFHFPNTYAKKFIRATLDNKNKETIKYYNYLVRVYKNGTRDILPSDFNRLFTAEKSKIDDIDPKWLELSFNQKCRQHYINKEFPSGCEPDTLYTWQGDDNFRKFKHRNTILRRKIKIPKTWTIFSPVSTYCYGPRSIRIKLKKEALFTPQTLPPILNEDFRVVYNVFFPYLDFSVNNTHVIDSWSYDTAEQFDEIVKEIAFWSQFPKNAYGLFKDDYYPGRNSSIAYSCQPERLPNRNYILVEHLIGILERILKNKGGVVLLNKTSEPYNLQYEKHFATDKATYFNQ